jgi:hypothetical protein
LQDPDTEFEVEYPDPAPDTKMDLNLMKNKNSNFIITVTGISLKTQKNCDPENTESSGIDTPFRIPSVNLITDTLA